MKFILFTLVMLLYAPCIVAQTRTVAGTVRDDTGEPIAGVGIRIVGTTIGTTTDANGAFTLSASQNAVLRISCVGYLTQEIPIADQSALHITLKEDLRELEEVVLVGFQAQKKVNLTGSVSSVGAEVFENRPVANIGQALQGVVPNLNISMSDGKPNTEPTFNLRGATSMDLNSDGQYVVTNKSPLILVDGVEMSATQINQMNPNDIEAMSVIKDASAAAIYGTKAPFGVILITTKSGKFNRKGQISYSYDLSYDKPSALPDIMNAYEIQRFVMRNGPWVRSATLTRGRWMPFKITCATPAIRTTGTL